MKKKKTPSAKR